jgi:tape measure domain-containing protein
MPLLAQLVVEYMADLSDLEAGTQKALDLMDQFGEAATDGPEILEGVFTELADEAENLSSSISSAADTIDESLNVAADASDTLATSFRDRAIGAADDFSAKMSSLISPVTSFASNLTGNVGSALSDFGTKLAEASLPAVAFGSNVADAVSNGTNILQTKLIDAGVAVVGFSEKVASVGSTILSNISSPFQQASTIIAGFGLKAQDGISDAVDVIKSKFASIAAPVVDFGQKVLSSAQPLIEFGQNIIKAMEPVGSFISSLAEGASSLAEFAMSAADSEGPLSSFGSSIMEAGSNLLDLGSKIGMAYFGLQGFIQMFEQMGNALVGGDASMEQTQVAFTSLLGSSQAARLELQKLQQFAASTPFQFPDLATDTQQLIAFQIPLNQTQPLLQAIGDSLSDLGEGTPAKMQQVVDVFGQMNSGTTLQTQDLKQLQSVGINAFQILADQMGKPVATIKEMVTAGLIPASDGIQMLQKGMEATFGGGMQAQANTFNGLISTLQDNIGMAWRAFSGPLFDGAKAALKDLLADVSAPGFQKFATDMGKNVGGAISGVLKFVGQLKQSWQSLSDAFTSSGVSGALANLGATLKTFGTTVGPMIEPLIYNISSGLSNLGAVVLTYVTPAINGLSGFIKQMTPTVQSIIQKISDFTLNLTNNGLAMDALKVTAMVVIGAITGGFVLWAIAAGGAALETLLALSPFILLGAAIGGLVALFILAYNNSLPFRNVIQTLAGWFMQLWSVISTNFNPAMAFLGGLFKQIGQIIATSFTPIWQQLVIVFQTQILPAWTQLQTAIQPILPQLEEFAEFLGGVLVVSLILVTGFVVGLITAFAGMIPGIAQAIGGVIQIFSGLVQIVSGIVAFIVDLFHGNFTHLGADLAVIWGGIVRVFQGAINLVQGIVKAGIGLVVGFFSGFIKTVVGLFTSLYNDLVGHSIVPDMINDIVNFIGGLPGKAVTALGSLVSKVGGVFTNLATSALGWMSDLGNNIVDGINGIVGNVGQAAQNVADAIGNVIHFSLPSEGPLMHADQFMPDLGSLLESGLNDQVGKVRSAAGNIASAIAGASGSAQIGISAVGSTSASVSPSRSSQTVYVVMDSSTTTSNPVVLNVNGREIARANIEAEHTLVGRRNR